MTEDHVEQNDNYYRVGRKLPGEIKDRQGRVKSGHGGGPTKTVATEEDLLTLEDMEAEVGYSHADVRDTGLYPRYVHFHSNVRNEYLALIPGKVNALVSEWWMRARNGSQMDLMPHARMMFLDSGAITPMAKCAKGLLLPEDVRNWLKGQPDLLARTHALYERGVTSGIVGHMDVPQYPGGLAAAEIDPGEAMEITLENARTFVELSRELPPGWKPAFMLQGPTQAAYLDCIAVYESLGIIAMAQRGEAWLAVGGTLATAPPALYTIYKTVREAVGPDPHIHALGVSRERELVYMARRGWIDGSDSSSAAQAVIYNTGPYHTDGPRSNFFGEACFAAQATYMDAKLARLLTEADASEVFEQAELI